MPSEFHLFLQHPTISDGITDEETVLVTLASSAYAGNPGLIDSLLDPARVMLESRVVQLPVAGAVELMIARTEPGPQRGMDVLEATVRFTEMYMGEPFPVNTVILLYADALRHGFGGTEPRNQHHNRP